jgi:hypothetical protein
MVLASLLVDGVLVCIVGVLSDDTTLAHVTWLEFIHYNLVLYNKQILDPIEFKANKDAHVYSLLSCISVGKEGSENITL